MMQSFAECAVANLIMVLQRVYELPGRSIACRRTPPLCVTATRRPLTFVQPTLLDAAGNFFEGAGVVGVVALVVTRQIAAQGVVKVISPDSVQSKAAVLDRLEIAHVVLVGLGHQS